MPSTENENNHKILPSHLCLLVKISIRNTTWHYTVTIDTIIQKQEANDIL